MLTVAALKEFGANTEEGLSRCMNNEAFYLRLVKMAAQESANYEALGKALESRDMKAGFEAAHGLKGMLANLALDPLTKPASEITEILRAGQPGREAECAELYRELMKQREAFVAVCSD